MASHQDGSDSEDLFASPSQAPRAAPPASADSQEPAANQSSRFDVEEARDAALRQELAGVRSVNEVIEGVLNSLERAKGNMTTVSQTVTNASTLLNTWTRILSQTEHNQRLILNPKWKGATQDLQEIEQEAQQKQLAAERRAAEEERRREEVRRKAQEEDQRRQAAAASRGTRGTRGRGRGGVTREGIPSYPSSYADTSNSSTASSRAGSGIGRGFGTTRGGRGRGGVR